MGGRRAVPAVFPMVQKPKIARLQTSSEHGKIIENISGDHLRDIRAITVKGRIIRFALFSIMPLSCDVQVRQKSEFQEATLNDTWSM